MSTAVGSTSAAEGRLFVFDDAADAHVETAAFACPERSRRSCPVERSSTGSRQSHLQSTINDQKFPPASITPASRLEIRPAPEMASSGISALDALTGGLPRGCLTEICGPASSGRSTVLLAALAAATRRGEFCALVDASDALDPHSAAATGVDLDHLLWVRCDEFSPQRHRDTEKNGNGKKPGCPILAPRSLRDGACPEQAKRVEGVGIFSQTALNFNEKSSRVHEHRLDQLLRATDLLLESGGFGLIVLDLADVPPQSARRIPLTTWFRFRRAVEYKPTILLAIAQQAIAGSCSSLLLRLAVPSTQYPVPSSSPSHTNLLTELQICAELIRSRHDRKPARSIAFDTKTAWAG